MIDLTGKTVAILVADDVEEAELTGPLNALEEAGANVDLISISNARVQTMNEDVHPSQMFESDKMIGDASADDYDALVMPGGTINADHLRANDDALDLIRDFADQDKPIAAICHAPWALISADIVDGRQLTSFPSLQDDVRNAGGTWIDKEVVVDGTLITSRKPDDIPAFNDALLKAIRDN